MITFFGAIIHVDKAVTKILAVGLKVPQVLNCTTKMEKNGDFYACSGARSPSTNYG